MAGGGFYLLLGVAGLSVFSPTALPIETSDPSWSTVDYMFRALAGVWLALGLMFAYMVPTIEKHGAWFALACVAIFGMGVGRLLSSISFEAAPANSLGAMVTELVVPPLLVAWQRRVASAQG